MSTKSILEVKGMTCENCVRHVTQALAAVSGVKDAVVRLQPGEAEVTHEEACSMETLVRAIEEEGYAAKPRTPASPAS